jgi:hypothetical protein
LNGKIDCQEDLPPVEREHVKRYGAKA